MRNLLRTSLALIARMAPVASVLGLLACSNPSSLDQVGQKQVQGGQIGLIAGNVVGAAIPGGSAAVQTIKGHAPTIGTMVGTAIGASLDEEDRRALAQATQVALSSGASKTFANKRTGVRGSVSVTTTAKSSSGQPCRTVKQEVVLKDGTRLNDTVSACKGANGWEV